RPAQQVTPGRFDEITERRRDGAISSGADGLLPAPPCELTWPAPPSASASAQMPGVDAGASQLAVARAGNSNHSAARISGTERPHRQPRRARRRAHGWNETGEVMAGILAGFAAVKDAWPPTSAPAAV